MENIGALSILLAFCLAVYAVIGSVIGKIKKNPFLVVSGERATYCVWILLTTASGLLIYSLLTGDFRLGYVASHTDQTMPAIYKFTAWWGGQEGSLLLWAWLLATYSAIVVFTNRRKFRDMMPWVNAVLMATESFFLILIAFVLSPFSILEMGRGNVVEGMGRGLNPLLAVLDHDHPSAHAVFGLRRIHGAVCLCDGIADYQAAGRSLDSHHAPLDHRDLAVPKYRDSARTRLGVRSAGLGRILGLGPGGERIAAALDHRHRVSALGDDAGKEGHDEGLEHGPGFRDLLPVHLRHVPDALGRGQLGARFRAVAHWKIFRLLPGHRNRSYARADSGSYEIPQE